MSESNENRDKIEIIDDRDSHLEDPDEDTKEDVIKEK